MARKIAATYEISKQTKRLISNKNSVDDDFPIEDMKQLRFVETKLKNDSEYYEQVVIFCFMAICFLNFNNFFLLQKSYFRSIKLKDKKGFTKAIKDLFNDDLLFNFTYHGSKDKLSFKDLKLNSAFFGKQKYNFLYFLE